MHEANDVFLIIVGATIVLLLLVALIVSLMFINQKRHILHKMEMKRMKEEVAKEILLSQLEIKESTLKNVSLELHDNLGQILSLINLNLSAIELPENAASVQKLLTTQELVSRVLQGMRDLSRTMDPDSIGRGLVSCIESELHLIRRSGRYVVQFDPGNGGIHLPSSTEIVIFRMIQESLSNVMRHSQATAIVISLQILPARLTISIADNGKGFLLADSHFTQGSTNAGLRNMRHRAKLIGADLDIDTSPGKGTKVTISVEQNELL